jgi:hypothetical protein
MVSEAWVTVVLEDLPNRSLKSDGWAAKADEVKPRNAATSKMTRSMKFELPRSSGYSQTPH